MTISRTDDLSTSTRTGVSRVELATSGPLLAEQASEFLGVLARSFRAFYRRSGFPTAELAVTNLRVSSLVADIVAVAVGAEAAYKVGPSVCEYLMSLYDLAQFLAATSFPKARPWVSSEGASELPAGERAMSDSQRALLPYLERLEQMCRGGAVGPINFEYQDEDSHVKFTLGSAPQRVVDRIQKQYEHEPIEWFPGIPFTVLSERTSLVEATSLMRDAGAQCAVLTNSDGAIVGLARSVDIWDRRWNKNAVSLPLASVSRSFFTVRAGESIYRRGQIAMPDALHEYAIVVNAAGEPTRVVFMPDVLSLYAAD